MPITHNNDGKFYRIAIDIAKEGAQLFDLTPYFKGRVGDNNFGLQIVWYYQGQLLNVVGMKPHVQGQAGQYSFEKDNNEKSQLVMSPKASTVDFVGDPNDCEEGGRVTYYFPEQMFPQDGCFKGSIGLIDDSGKKAHYTSVDVWFKILPGSNGYMGRACDFYINKLDIALKEAEQQLKEKETSMQEVVDEFSKKITDLVSSINKQATDTETLLNTLRSSISALEDKIKQDNLLTKGDIQAFEDAITAKYQKLEDNVKAAGAKVLNHQYEYMSMSIAIGNGVQGQSTFDNSYLACQNNLMDFTLIDRVDVQNETNFTLTDDNMMKYAIGKLQQNGRKIVMLKPHLFLASNWEPYRGDYKPNDVSAFYTNWEKVLDRDAQLCIDNNIPVLCIEVEMDEVFADANYEYARTMIANLRNKYPKLKLTVANDKYFVSGYQRIFDLVDFIGINIYPSFSSSVPTKTNDISMAKAAEFMFNSDRLAEKIDNIVLQFGKPILITEIGLYPFKEGLVQPQLQSTIQTGDIVSGKVVPDFSATALAMKAAINGLAYTPSVVGLTWFSSGVPMFFKDYYHDDLSTRNEAEKAWNQLCERYYWEGRNGK
ncbi:glycoside hydrolase family 113 [Limosilactobacillus reuteri]|uniref:glycoside hydrolase family 113 n=1 Tax=Limosilactobacillus reuteri TaxID=1598 RepID=UPI0015DEBD75|nr:hypothetical protein [Limosilactobacillus reuteri]QLL75902.1 hypothetical protein GTO86_04655 [Limosilactobacillus reuteri]